MFFERMLHSNERKNRGLSREAGHPSLEGHPSQEGHRLRRHPSEKVITRSVSCDRPWRSHEKKQVIRIVLKV